MVSEVALRTATASAMEWQQHIEDARRRFAGELSKLGADDWRNLVAQAETRVYRNNEVLLAQGFVGAPMFMVVAGQVRVERRSQEATAQLARLGPGAVLGEMAFLDRSDAGASASIVADGDVEALYVDRARLNALVRTDQGFALRLYQSLAIMLARRLRATNELIRP